MFVCVLQMDQGGVRVRQNRMRSYGRLRDGSVEPRIIQDIKVHGAVKKLFSGLLTQTHT